MIKRIFYNLYGLIVNNYLIYSLVLRPNISNPIAGGPAYFELHPSKGITICTFLFNLPGLQKPEGIISRKFLAEWLKMYYMGFYPINLFPKLTEETKDNFTYLLLDDKMKVEQRVLAQTEYEVYIVPGRRTILFT